MAANAPIVLIHGLFGSLGDSVILDAFDEPRPRAPDLLGYGTERDALFPALTLDDQADHVIRHLDRAGIQRAALVGHSVGGAVAVRCAVRHPERVAALVSVEGNLMPADAFWSAGLAKRSLGEIDDLVDGYRVDVAGWIEVAGVGPTSDTVRIASDWLANQPSATLKAQARAVVEATADASYLEDLRQRLDGGLELHLLAGARSRQGWHVPPDIERAAASMTVLPRRGHLMMLEAPGEFARAIEGVLD